MQTEVTDLGELSTEMYGKARARIRSTGNVCVVRKERRKMTGYCVMEVESMIGGDSDHQGEILPKGQERSGLRGVPWRSV